MRGWKSSCIGYVPDPFQSTYDVTNKWLSADGWGLVHETIVATGMSCILPLPKACQLLCMDIGTLMKCEESYFKCVCVCVCMCVRACVRACACVCVCQCRLCGNPLGVIAAFRPMKTLRQALVKVKTPIPEEKKRVVYEVPSKDCHSLHRRDKEDTESQTGGT